MWKTFSRRCIYASSRIRVYQNFLFRWLQFESKAVQTLIYRYAPQKYGLRYIKSLILGVELRPATCCMLGLGGGGAAHALSPLLKTSNLVIVEKNAEVIAIAKQFFMIDQLKNIEILHEDANEFLRKTPAKFHHLLIDLFTANEFPSQCNNEEFFANCKRVLEPEGLLAINLANTHEHLPLLHLLQQQFSQAILAILVPGTTNLILFAQNGTRINPFLDRLSDHGKLRKLSWATPWGYVADLR